MKELTYKHSKEAEITCKSDPNDVRIFINGILHFYILRDEIVSFQSWYISKTCCQIKIYTKSKNILLEYNSVEKWKEVLSIFDLHL